MNRIRIVISVLVVPLILIVFFVIHVNIIKEYAFETERSNLVYTIDSRENVVMDIVRDYSSYDELIDKSLENDTAWLRENVFNILEDYNLVGVAVLDSEGKVCCSADKGGNIDFDATIQLDSKEFMPLFYYSNLVTYNRVLGDSVYTLFVSRLRRTDKSLTEKPMYFMVVNRVNTSDMHQSTIYIGSDTLNAKIAPSLLSIVLKNPGGKKIGYLNFEFSDNYSYVFRKVNYIFAVVLLLVVLIIMFLIFVAQKSKVVGKVEKDLPTLHIVEPTDNHKDDKPDFESIISQNYLGFILTDPMGKITYANRSFENATLYSLQELIDEQPILFWTTESLPVFNYDFWRRLSSGKAWKGEIFCRRKDATELRLSATFTPIKKGGYVTGYAAAFEDVSKDTTVEDELKEFNRKYSAILDNCSDVILIYDYNKKKIMFVSPAVKELMGYTQNEFLEKDVSELLDASSLQRIKHIFSKNLVENPELDRTAYGKTRLICKAKSYIGNYVDVELSLNPLFNTPDSPYPSELVIVAHDVTETQKVLKKLSDSEDKYRMIAENTVDMIWKIDPNTFNINYINNSVERMLGYSKSEFLKMNLRDILQGESLNRITMKASELIRQGSFAEPYHRFKATAFCKNGDLREVESVVSVITDSFGLKEFLGVTRDVTESNRYEQRLKETLWQMEKLIETLPAKIFMKDRFNRYVLVNSLFAESIGLPIERIKGYKSEQIPMPEDFSIIINQDEDILKTGISYLNQDILIKSRDGINSWYSVSQVPYGDEGKIMGIIGFMVDISKQKHYEKVLEETLKRTNLQKNELMASTRSTQESMMYAKRIQDALLKSSNEVLRKYVPNSFVFYRPKDIVGGDFVYACATADGLVCAVVDCTGHGTPGALMSVMAISLLNDIFGITIWKHTPADVLEELRRRVIGVFSNSVIERDGFDICMIFKEFNSDKIIYSGANLPLYICRDNQLIKLNAVRCPIGYHPSQKNFENQEFKIQKGDMLYLSSDGYADQFGHLENRRYYQSDFAQLLLRISANGLREQKQDLDDVLQDWKGERRQTDDITVFGIRVSEISQENAI